MSVVIKGVEPGSPAAKKGGRSRSYHTIFYRRASPNSPYSLNYLPYSGHTRLSLNHSVFFRITVLLEHLNFNSPASV